MRHWFISLPLMALTACGISETKAPKDNTARLAVSKDDIILPKIPAEGAIYLNQIGFETASPKIAIMQSASKSALKWSLIKNGESILEGRSQPLGLSAQANQPLHKIDFSSFVTAGDDYVLRVGPHQSSPFKIGSGLYTQMKYDALSYFYHNRAKDPIEAAYVGKDHARPAGHPVEMASCVATTDMWGTEWTGCDYTLDVSGGWYDAGDHGKYVVNSGISVWTLLSAYENFKPAFADGNVKIPESGNGVNDMLDEARTNIEFMLAMQVPDGGFADVASGGQQENNKPLSTQRIKAEGLVHHKVHAKQWPGDAVMPHEFTQERFVYPPSTGATLNVAAIGAYCARIWRGIDDAFASRCLTSAQKAWTAANIHPDIYAYSNFDGGGPYGDRGYADDFYWAAKELFLTTGDARYSKAIKQYKAADRTNAKADQPGFNNTALLGDLSAKERRNILRISDLILADTPKEPLHIPYYKKSYHWGSNSELANRAVILGHAYMLTEERKYRDGVVHLMDYLLGRNPLGQSYISGYGTQQYFNPHHRHWAASIRKGAPTVPAGVLSGGPNDDNMSDPVAETQIGTCAAQTCWTDHYLAWTQNEITINWNAPLVWVSSFLDATEPQP
jgi:endoglucanase